MIAIQSAAGGFSDRWISYCILKKIPYKRVDCYQNDIISQLQDCQALMWQFYQGSSKDHLVAKQIMSSAEALGKIVFPNYNTRWHFDDKIGQKYLLEAIEAPFVPTWVFLDKKEAENWASETSYPKVFKLRGGAGSQNVRLVKNSRDANKLIKKAFGRGLPSYDPFGSLKERWRLLWLNKTDLIDVVEGIARIAIPPKYARFRGPERGYIYFQEFIANNDHDIRVVVIGDKAFAIKRMVRRGDFRASGSGIIFYNRDLFDENTIKTSFLLADKLRVQCVAFDFINDNGTPLIVEISFGFSPAGYDPCPGYWDKNLNWHEGKFNPYGWMVENVMEQIRNDQKNSLSEES